MTHLFLSSSLDISFSRERDALKEVLENDISDSTDMYGRLVVAVLFYGWHCRKQGRCKVPYGGRHVLCVVQRFSARRGS